MRKNISNNVMSIILSMSSLILNLEFNKSNVEKIKCICDALSNEYRVRSLLILEKDGRMPLDAFHKEAEKMKIYNNIETSYRNLEILVASGLLTKTYDSKSKKLVYEINKSLFEVSK